MTEFEQQEDKEQKENVERLLKLIAENPDLPIVPMVDSDVVADDGGYWRGKWEPATTGDYLCEDECIYFKSDDEVEPVLSAAIGYDAFERMTDEEAKQAYENLPWTKAIIVYITT